MLLIFAIHRSCWYIDCHWSITLQFWTCFISLNQTWIRLSLLSLSLPPEDLYGDL